MRDLCAALAKAKVAGPYVMAGHSLGGMHNRLFARLYPKEVVGMVLVDSFNEDELAPERSLIPPEVLKKIPPEHLKVFVREDLDLEASAAQARENRWRGAIPMIVLTRAPLDRAKHEEKELWPGQVEGRERQRVELQNDLASRSTNSKHVIAERSGHNIQVDRPELVVESIRQVIEATRATNGKKW